jgi:hypothetical protein
MTSRTTGSPRSRDSRKAGGDPPEGERTLRHVKRVLAGLRREAPDLHATLASCLRLAPGRYQVGAERFTIIAKRGAIVATPGWRIVGTRVEAELPPQAILDLVEGTATILDLVERNILRIKADADALLAVDDAFRALATAAVSSRVLLNEFDRYRTWVLGLPSEDRDARRIR